MLLKIYILLIIILLFKCYQKNNNYNDKIINYSLYLYIYLKNYY